jgi:hypothetical protein
MTPINIVNFLFFLKKITKRAKAQEKRNYNEIILGGYKPLLINNQNVLKNHSDDPNIKQASLKE